MRGAAVVFKGAASGVLVLLTATVVCCQSGWSVTYSSSQICALEGSTVEIRCSYSYPRREGGVTTRVINCFWFTKEGFIEPVDLSADSKYSGRVRYEECHLIITDVRKSDSGVFKFRFITNQKTGKFTGNPGVTLNVTDPKLQINVRRRQVSNYRTLTELTCHSDCQLPGDVSYVWYQNGQRVHGETKKFIQRSIIPSGRYRCAINRYEMFPSPDVYAPDVTSVSVSPSTEVMEGGSVTLTCSSDANPAAKYIWNKEDGVIKLFSTEPHHVFSSIQSSDSGRYLCKAENDLGSNTASIFINVKYPPKPPSVSVSPSDQIEEGEAVTLTCSSKANPTAKYTWYKDNKKLPNGLKADYRVPSITSEDRGRYVCTSENQYGRRNSSSLFVDVLYPPRPPSVSVNTSGEIMEGGSVTLTCSSDANPAAKYTWNKEDGIIKLFSIEPQNVFSSIQSSDSGWYLCEAENDLGSKTARIFIDVKYPPRPPSVSVNTSGEIMEGGLVTLTCSSDANPAAKYTWYKKDDESPLSSGQNFTISSIKPEHSGLYFCKVQNSIGHNNSTIQLTVAASTNSWKSATAGIIVVFLIIILLLIFLVMRKQRSSIPPPELGEIPSVIKQHQLRTSKKQDEQEDLHYASVRFLKNQSDPVYMNIRSLDAHRPKQEENDSTVYAVVNLVNSQRTQVEDSAEDTSAVYSVVNKLR